MRCFRTKTLLALSIGAALSSQASGQFRTPEWKDFHNNTYVGPEPEPLRLAFFEANEALAADRELDAGRDLLRIARSTLDGRVDFGERLVLRSDRAAALRLLALPEEVRRELREADAELARTLWNNRRGPEDAETRRLLHRLHPLDALSERALYEQGLALMLEGHVRSSAAYFERLVHWPSLGPGSLREEAAARLRQCLSMQGLPVESTELERWPEGSLRVAGEERPPDSPQLRLPQRQGEERNASGDDTRVQRPTHAAPPDTPARWAVRCAVGERHDAMRAPHRHRYEVGLRTEAVLPSGLPLVWGDRLLVLEADGVHLRSLADGRDRIEPVRWDFDLHIDPERFQVDLEASAASIAGQVLYLNLRVADRGTYPERAAGALFRLDLSRELYVESSWRSWEEVDGKGVPVEAPWSFTGPPLELDGRLFLPATRREENDTECQLLRFDARTLQPVERCFLARGRAVDRFADRFANESGGRQVFPTPVSARNGVLYVCTNLGVVAAVRAADLGLEWMFRYNQMVPADSRRYSREHFYVTGGWPSRVVEVYADRILVAPSDSRYLYSLARWPSAAGDLVLNDPVEKESRLAWVGSDPERLFFLVRRLAGRTDPQVAVECTDHSGNTLWQTDPLPIQEPPVGLVAQTDRYLYVPTDRLVYRVDLSREGSWDLVLPPPDSIGVPYPEYGAFGDLMATEGWLVSRSAGYLTVFAVPR